MSHIKWEAGEAMSIKQAVSSVWATSWTHASPMSHSSSTKPLGVRQKTKI